MIEAVSVCVFDIAQEVEARPRISHVGSLVDTQWHGELAGF